MTLVTGIRPYKISAAPSATSSLTASGPRPSPQGLSRGKAALSRSTTRAVGRSCKYRIAAADPAGPAPMMMRSTDSITLQREEAQSPLLIPSGQTTTKRRKQPIGSRQSQQLNLRRSRSSCVAAEQLQRANQRRRTRFRALQCLLQIRRNVQRVATAYVQVEQSRCTASHRLVWQRRSSAHTA